MTCNNTFVLDIRVKFGDTLLNWLFGKNVNGWHDILLKTTQQGMVEGDRHRGRLRKLSRDNSKQWTGQSLSLLLLIADIRSWRAVGVTQRRPSAMEI